MTKQAECAAARRSRRDTIADHAMAGQTFVMVAKV
jgi:hypothetical protein